MKGLSLASLEIRFYSVIRVYNIYTYNWVYSCTNFIIFTTVQLHLGFCCTFLLGVTLGRKMRRPRMLKPVKKEKGHGTMTYATTTPLVTSVFNQMFKVCCCVSIVISYQVFRSFQCHYCVELQNGFSYDTLVLQNYWWIRAELPKWKPRGPDLAH